MEKCILKDEMETCDENEIKSHADSAVADGQAARDGREGSDSWQLGDDGLYKVLASSLLVIAVVILGGNIGCIRDIRLMAESLYTKSGIDLVWY